MGLPAKLLKYRFDHKIKLLKSILESTEVLIAQKIDDFEKGLAKDTQEMNEEDADLYYEYKIDDYNQLTQAVPEIFWISQFVGVASFLEAELTIIRQHLCDSKLSDPVEFKKILNKKKELAKSKRRKSNNKLLRNIPSTELLALAVHEVIQTQLEKTAWDDLAVLIWLRNEYVHNGKAIVNYEELTEKNLLEIVPGVQKHEPYSLEAIRSKLRVTPLETVVPQSSLVEYFIDRVKAAIDPIYEEILKKK